MLEKTLEARLLLILPAVKLISWLADPCGSRWRANAVCSSVWQDTERWMSL